MYIVGGTYRELCEHPEWNSLYGSGARAAYIVQSLSPNSHFYTYLSEQESLNGLNIPIHSFERNSPIVFSYFHPLSNPIIQPRRNEIVQQETIELECDTVLRFGLLEGDVRVKAKRAVYDPQTWIHPAQFFDNGSVCEELAMVLNEIEIKSITFLEDIDEAASKLLEHPFISVVVVKRGVFGATVYAVGIEPRHVPVYFSEFVFKIGTGDIFSAVFAYYWLDKKLSAEKSADLASRAVSLYCDSEEINLEALKKRHPIFLDKKCEVIIECNKTSLGQKYVYEEACYTLDQLGIYYVDKSRVNKNDNNFVLFVIEDKLSSGQIEYTNKMMEQGTQVVVLHEYSERSLFFPKLNYSTSDFCTAMYYVAWASMSSFFNGNK